jgi:hypothetical protein
MNKEQQELLDDAFSKFLKYKRENLFDTRWDVIIEMNTSDNTKPYFVTGRPLIKEEFINKCKNDSEFSERWGLKIEERELSRDERCDEYIKRHPKETNDGILNYKWIGDNLCTHEDYDKWNIPTKLITITYNDTKLESYE